MYCNSVRLSTWLTRDDICSRQRIIWSEHVVQLTFLQSMIGNTIGRGRGKGDDDYDDQIIFLYFDTDNGDDKHDNAVTAAT